MMKKYFFYFLQLAILGQFMACGIGDDTGSLNREQYIFNQVYTLSNVKKTYQPDDFIFMEYSLADKMMTDSATGQTIQVGNARMFPTLNVIGPLDGSLAGEDRFEFSLVEGQVVAGADDFSDQGYLKFNIGCPDNLSYQTKINIKFPEQGGYVMFLDYGAATPFHSFPFTANDNCSEVGPNAISPNADIGFVQFFFNVSDTNLDEFDAYVADLPNPDPASREVLRTALDEKRAFFVRVE